ncbi:Rap1a/Tai family immunity protein [Sphingomonas pruni]|uniref:Rap1a/Tai family immunity protein n=1 Tax=Sphingomonas pruni TaxID=40683 RepID=UPI000B01C774|nr:Rap1a/Tai family immunity protein [Sphingomonas pruni]
MIGLAMMLAGATSPGFKSGIELYNDCMRPDRAACISYVAGVADTMMGMSSAGIVKPWFCLPPGSKAGELADVVTKYLKDYPTERLAGASGVVAHALLTAYPCPKT